MVPVTRTQDLEYLCPPGSYVPSQPTSPQVDRSLRDIAPTSLLASFTAAESVPKTGNRIHSLHTSCIGVHVCTTTPLCICHLWLRPFPPLAPGVQWHCIHDVRYLSVSEMCSCRSLASSSLAQCKQGLRRYCTILRLK